MGPFKKYFLFLAFASLVRSTIQEQTECPPNEVDISEALKAFEKPVRQEREIRSFCQKFYHTEASEISTTANQVTGGKYASCAELLYAGFKDSGIYLISLKPWISSTQLSVYCDMKTNGGGWTVFQRRGEFGDPAQSFMRSWYDYANGFGNLTKQFWLGNHFIHLLTLQERVMLRVDLQDHEGNTRYAEYDDFEVGNVNKNFEMKKLGRFIGDIGDSFSGHLGVKFSTLDQDNEHECSKKYKGGWWYKGTGCYQANLNGIYTRRSSKSNWEGYNWGTWHGYNYSMKWGEMKLRPKGFKPTQLST